MSRKVLFFQRTEAGVVFGLVPSVEDFMNMQKFAHGHIESVVRDMLMLGAPGALVAGFDYALPGGLQVSVSPGHAVTTDGISHDTLPEDKPTIAQLSNAHVSLPRIDLICARLDNEGETDSQFRNFRRLPTDEEMLTPGFDPYPVAPYNAPTKLDTQAVVVVVEGVAAAVPAAPPTPAGHVALYQVRVNPGVTELQADKVTDVRTPSAIRSLYQAWTQIDSLGSEVTNIGEQIDDRVNGLVVDSTYLTKSYNDPGNLLTLDVDLAALIAALNATYVNVTGDAMTGALAVPLNGFTVGVNQIKASAGGVGIGSDPVATFMLAVTGNVSVAGTTLQVQGVHPRLHLFDTNLVSPAGRYFIISGTATDADEMRLSRFLTSGLSSSQDTLRILANNSAVFAGALVVTGNLSKGSGTFHIDHPLNPDNRDLIHGFVESPFYDLLYRGRVELVNGEAEVDVDKASGMTPGTFEALTQNVQFHPPYNETGWEQVRIRPNSLKGGKFIIECQDKQSNDTVTWSLIAERADEYIMASETTDDQGRLIVEIEKEEADPARLAPQTRTEEVIAGVTKAGTQEFDEVSSSTIGKKGYRRHAAVTGKGKVPKRHVTLRRVEPPPAPEEKEKEGKKK